jgi:hypothetical protein
VWYSTRNDRAQRQMLRAAIQASNGRWSSLLPKLRDDLIWQTEKIDALALRRNEAIHVPCSAYTTAGGTQITAAFLGNNPHAKKLEGVRLIEEFSVCEADSDVLSRYARRIRDCIQSARNAYPERPQLQSATRREPRKQRKSPDTIHYG